MDFFRVSTECFRIISRPFGNVLSVWDLQYNGCVLVEKERDFIIYYLSFRCSNKLKNYVSCSGLCPRVHWKESMGINMRTYTVIVIKSCQQEVEDVDVACSRVVCDGSLAGQPGVARDRKSTTVVRYVISMREARRRQHEVDEALQT